MRVSAGPAEWRRLACGFDTLCLALNVDWGRSWETLDGLLREARAKAKGRTGGVAAIAEFGHVIVTGSKLEHFRYHLRLDEWDMFVAGTPRGERCPNVRVNIHPGLMWRLGASGAVAHVCARVRDLGGHLLEAPKPSRADLCADFCIPGGLDQSFLDRHKVARATVTLPRIERGRLVGYTIGAEAADIRAKFYHKGPSIGPAHQPWFREVWGLEDTRHVWRTEFQVRRRAMRDLGIDTVPQLVREGGHLWAYLTSEWLSLRVPDNANQSRRTVHPWWAEVQAAATQLGEVAGELRRGQGRASLKPADSVLRHIAGCVEGYAARLGLTAPEETLEVLGEALGEHWDSQTDSFADRVAAKVIRLGVPIEEKGVAHAA